MSNFLQEIYRNPNLFLAVLTAVYVILTFSILRANQKLLKANLMPIFFSRVSIKSNSLQFELKNYSSYPAYDVDVWLIGTYEEGDVPHKSLLQKKYAKAIKIDFEDTLFPIDEFRFYGILDHVTYCAFPPKTKCSFTPQFTKKPEMLNLILQYRDATGKNYLYQAWLYSEEGAFLKSGHLNYSPLKAISRIDYGYCLENFMELREISKIVGFFHFLKLCNERILNKMKARLYLDKEIRDILKRVIPAGYQEKFKNHFGDIEDRGLFQQIK